MKGATTVTRTPPVCRPCSYRDGNRCMHYDRAMSTIARSYLDVGNCYAKQATVDPDDERCEYCGTDDARLELTSDGKTLLCPDCRPAYEPRDLEEAMMDIGHDLKASDFENKDHYWVGQAVRILRPDWRLSEFHSGGGCFHLAVQFDGDDFIYCTDQADYDEFPWLFWAMDADGNSWSIAPNSPHMMYEVQPTTYGNIAAEFVRAVEHFRSDPEDRICY